MVDCFLTRQIHAYAEAKLQDALQNQKTFPSLSDSPAHNYVHLLTCELTGRFTPGLELYKRKGCRARV